MDEHDGNPVGLRDFPDPVCQTRSFMRYSAHLCCFLRI